MSRTSKVIKQNRWLFIFKPYEWNLQPLAKFRYSSAGQLLKDF